MDVELTVDVDGVSFDGLRGNEKLFGNLLVAHPLLQKGQNLDFTDLSLRIYNQAGIGFSLIKDWSFDKTFAKLRTRPSTGSGHAQGHFDSITRYPARGLESLDLARDLEFIERRKKAPIAIYFGAFLSRNGSPGRTRTADQVVNSHPLYQLSYRGKLQQKYSRKLFECQ